MEHEILRAKQTPSSNFWVDLCHLPTNSVTPYATWITPEPRESAPKFSGHYHRSLEDAKADWDARTC
ncbi:MAG: hypothetical protein FJY85_15620 [Deltaproteobacteria bacterium]|nr:hypothetical protein [Deltaproteobacteria bacterium]